MVQPVWLYCNILSQPSQCYFSPCFSFVPVSHPCPLLSWPFCKRKIPDKDNCKKLHLLLVRAVENMLALLGLGQIYLAPLSFFYWPLYYNAFDDLALFKLDMCFAKKKKKKTFILDHVTLLNTSFFVFLHHKNSLFFPLPPSLLTNSTVCIYSLIPDQPTS